MANGTFPLPGSSLKRERTRFDSETAHHANVAEQAYAADSESATSVV